MTDTVTSEGFGRIMGAGSDRLAGRAGIDACDGGADADMLYEEQGASGCETAISIP